MSLRSTAARFGIAASCGVLTALVAGGGAFAAAPAHNDPPTYKGRVTAHGGLLLRDAPNRDSAVIRSVPYGSYVDIFCKAKGGSVDGNRVWYLLTDGTWAWGSSRYIATVGQPPRWC
ncbi:SH3 domain-containing protein [Streptomyces sp. NPDC050560]|uniref:SH3 domain-containing protein n=1 Tax=Streptomyces sp. NPDC050560 TaxID=3365630 RepID=UPI0037950F10